MIGSIFIINSCQKENTIEKTSTANQSFILNDQEACTISETLFSSKQLRSLKAADTNSSQKSKKVKDITPYSDNNKLIAYYVVNYEDGGFAVLSADKRLSPILAFSDCNSLSNDVDENLSPIEFWFQTIKEKIEFVRKNNIPATKQIQQEWKNLESGNSDFVFLKSAPPDTQCTDSYHQVGPFLSTTWNQKCGFNDLLKLGSEIGCTNLPCSRVLAGCVPIAMAQVMKYNQLPTSYNWALMPNASGSSETSRLIKAIHDVLPLYYDCNSTGSTDPNAAMVLRNNFGYSKATCSNYNYLNVVSDLDRNRPVILGGHSSSAGHTWVCDGYKENTICMYDDYGNSIGACSYMFLHMNWGWMDGKGNGWFSFDNFTVTTDSGTSTFNSNLDMIYNIMP